VIERKSPELSELTDNFNTGQVKDLLEKSTSLSKADLYWAVKNLPSTAALGGGEADRSGACNLEPVV
jgi:hypothetical protein